MKKSLFAIFLLLAVAVSVKAQESQTAYDFLRLPLSAHAAALGGDNVTLIEDDVQQHCWRKSLVGCQRAVC